MAKRKSKKGEGKEKETKAKGKPLLLVESPTKARTLAQYLRGKFVVLASKGHVKDLPPKELGVDLETFQPKYQVIKGKGKTLAFIKKVAKESDYILIGSDPDREGEAIAHHLAEELKKLKKPIKRVLFYEITPEAVREAVENPTDIDPKKVEAQKARRVLDRLVGYLISPILWKKIKGWGLSAGRVQTAALRLIVEREREIREFVPEPFWHIYAHFKEPGEFVAKTAKYEDKERAQEDFSKVKDAPFVVVEFSKEEGKANPPPPLKTSTLQQEAHRHLGFSAERTMQLAQKLFEGVEIDGKRVGLITYHRTDSTRLSRKGVNLLRKYIRENFPKEYLPARGRTYGRDRGNVQGAHEAIRPTYPSITPESLRGKIDEDMLKLYDLIWRRALASQMAPVRYEKRRAVLSAEGVEFVAEGLRILFPGWSEVWPYNVKEGELPDLREGQILKPEKVELVEDETKPPARYTQASLIKELERRGIGRPSTYATIISTLFKRRYIYRRGKALAPTERGEKVLDELLKYFKDLFDYGFTAKMEEDLDRIEEGKETYDHLIREFYTELEPKLKEAEGES
ncbi:MAG: type I DNA topoisomerase [Thermotogae bacterium]|nr:type I DNA topoisomerase [Thermotogota bacterium]